MEKFGSPKAPWEGDRDIAANAIGEEALKKADAMLEGAELELATETYQVTPDKDRLVQDPTERTPGELRTADDILDSDPSQNIYYVQERPDRLELSSAHSDVPIGQASYDTTPKVTEDPRFNHVGRNASTPSITRKQVAPPKEKGFFAKLFGG